jgi:hypothetical protein
MVSSSGIASANHFTLMNFAGDVLFLTGILAFFSYVFQIRLFSPVVSRSIFWVYIIYLLYAGLFTTSDSIMIGNNGIAYTEIEEEGWLIFSVILGILVFGVGVLLFSLYKGGFTRVEVTDKNKTSKSHKHTK